MRWSDFSKRHMQKNKRCRLQDQGWLCFWVLDSMSPIPYLEQCEHLLPTIEVARLLGVHQETIYRYTKAGKLKYVRVGRAIKFDPLDVLHFLRNR